MMAYRHLNMIHLLLAAHLLLSVPSASASQLEDCFNSDTVSNCILPQNLVADSGLLELRDARIERLRVGIFGNYGNVKTLDLSRNSISDIESGTFKGMVSLNKLLLTSNALETIQHGTFAGAGKVKILNLAQNEINWIDPGSFDGMRRLMLLNLNRNRLTEIPSNVFDGFPHMLYFYADDNVITTVSPTAFIGSHNLKIVKLHRNQIEAMSNAFKDLPQLKQLGVSRNPFQCDCRMEPFRQWLRARSNTIADLVNLPITCAGPSNLAEGDLRFQTDELTCERPFAVEVQNEISVDEGGYGAVAPKILGRPTPMLLWRDPFGSMVPIRTGETTSSPAESSGDGKHRVYVDGNGALILSDASRTDAGVYTFRAINVAGSFSSTVRVDVQRKKRGAVDLAGDSEQRTATEEESLAVEQGQCSQVNPTFFKILAIACLLTFLMTAAVFTLLFCCVHKRAMRRSKTFRGASPKTSGRRHDDMKAARSMSGLSLLSSLTRVSTMSNRSSTCSGTRRKRFNLNSYSSGADIAAAQCATEGDIVPENGAENAYIEEYDEEYEQPYVHPRRRIGTLPSPPSDVPEEAEGYMVPRKTSKRAAPRKLPKAARGTMHEETYASIDSVQH